MAGVFSGSLRFSNNQATTLLIFHLLNLIDDSDPHNDPDQWPCPPQHNQQWLELPGCDRLERLSAIEHSRQDGRQLAGALISFDAKQLWHYIVVMVLTSGVGDKTDGSWVRMCGVRPHLRHQGDAFHARGGVLINLIAIATFLSDLFYTAKESSCQTAKLPNCQTVKLPNCQYQNRYIMNNLNLRLKC